MNNSFIKEHFKSEIDILPIQTKIYHTIDSNKDELVIHKKEFKILPKLKFIRGRETTIIVSDKVIKRVKIDVSYSIQKEIRIKDCTKFHNDYIEYEVTKKIYDPSIKEFINKHLHEN